MWEDLPRFPDKSVPDVILSASEESATRMLDQVGHDYEARLLRSDAVEGAGDYGEDQVR